MCLLPQGSKSDDNLTTCALHSSATTSGGARVHEARGSNPLSSIAISLHVAALTSRMIATERVFAIDGVFLPPLRSNLPFQLGRLFVQSFLSQYLNHLQDNARV